MNKKIISLVLALVMVLGTFTSVFAAETTKKAEVKKEETKAEKVEKVVGKDNKIQYIIDKKFVEGYEDGSYGYDKNIKRSEVTKLLVYANGNKELAERLQGTMQLYSDVNTENWANGVINVGSTVKSDANGLVMLEGYPNGTFKPENNVTYAELAKMLVVLAKEDLTADMAKNAKWSADWMTWAAQLGILDDVTVANSDAAATRADAFTMIYNALYAMKEFKRVPANETRGIVSNLTNDKLTLNQDSEKEYKITGDTVIVDGKNERKQIVKVRNLNRLDLYKGSLVRVLINDKNEVTHILELGNPEKLAINNKNGVVNKDNNVWNGVADATVETAYYKNIESMKDAKQSDINKEYATVKLNSSATKGDYIKFHKTNGDVIANLKINDNTEVYVANPYNNIMKEVKDINEALSLIGFRGYGDNYKIANVYAGFDTDDHKSAVKGFDSAKYTAKVIVFNVVSKDNDGDRYRVIESSGSNFSTTLEDTDGKLYDRDNTLNKSNFPLEYGDKLDVIEIRGDVIDTILDHSKTKEYPVVKVEKVYDNDEIKVIDRFDNETLLYVGDADIFNAKQYKDLEKGDYLQFKANNKDARDIDVVSILEDNKDTRDLFDESGSVLNVVQGIEDHTVVGEVTRVGEKTMEVYIESDNWDKGLNKTHRVYDIDEGYAKALKVGNKIIFKVEDKENADHERAFDIRYNDGKNTPVTNEGKQTIFEYYLSLIEKLTPANEVTAKNIETVKDELKAINGVVLSNEDKFKFEHEYADHFNKLNDVKKAVEDVEAQEKEKARLDALTIEDLTAKLVYKDDNTTVDNDKTKTAIEDAVKAAVAKKADVEVDTIEVPAPAATDYAENEEVSVKVTLKSTKAGLTNVKSNEMTVKVTLEK